MNINKGVIKSKSRGKLLIPKGYNFIYHQVHNQQTALKKVLKKWIQKFHNNEKLAVLQLFQYFIFSSGCHGKIYLHMINFETSTIIKKMGKQFGTEYVGYPLIKKGPLGRGFSTKFNKFTKLYVKEIFKSSFVFDQQIDKIIQFLIDFSNSHYRPFRHTGTIAVLNMMSALMDLLLLSRNETQYKKEKIEQILSRLIKSVFLKRHRDTCAGIRARIIVELGLWMQKYPSFFLKDKYLKYMGWALFDEVGKVRLKCIHALKPLYIEENKDALEVFTNRFKDRIVNMANDTVDLVAWNVIKFINVILKIYNNVLDDEDFYLVLELIFCTNKKIAQAAGEFFHMNY